MRVSAIVQRVVEAQPLANEDEEFWWQSTGGSFATLLANAGYTSEQLERHLTWYRRYIPASLGPRPIPGQRYRFTSGPAGDGSPVEPSINWKETCKSRRLIRFTLGPSDSNAGTDADPFGQEESGRLLKRMSSVIPDLSMRTYNKFADNLFIKKENQAALVARLPDGTPRPQVWVAFDVQPSGLMPKVYFLPFLKMMETGTHTNDLIYTIHQQCSSDEFGSYAEGAEVLKSYIDTFDATPELAPRVMIYGIDCFDGPDSRIKTYLKSTANSLNKVKDLYTLGGRVSGPNVDGGLEALSQFWPIIFKLDSEEKEEDYADRNVFPDGCGAIACVEFKPNHTMPDVKIHLPMSLFASFKIKDGDLCDRLAKWFRARGDHEFADRYRSDLEETFPGHDFENSQGLITVISFTYTEKTGVYMSMYLSTRIFDIHVPEYAKTNAVEDVWAGWDKVWEDRERGITY